MPEPTRFNTEDTNTRGDYSLPNRVEDTTRIEFNPGGTEKFIRDRGIKVLVEKSWLCTCRNPRTLAPKPNCPICHGRGIAYLPATPDIMAIQSQEKGMVNGDLGLYESGTAIATTRLESKITFRDRITVPDVEIYQSFIFDVNENRIKNGFYLSYDVKYITLAMGGKGKPLNEGIDYEVDLEQNMFYPKQHLEGTNVSLNLAVTLRYMVMDLLKESRYQYTEFNKPQPEFENLPRKLLLKREDIFVDSEPFSLAIDTEKRLQELEENGETEMKDPKREGSRQSELGGFFGGKLNG